MVRAYTERRESDFVAQQTIEVDGPASRASDRDRSGLLVADDAVAGDDRHARRFVADERTSVRHAAICARDVVRRRVDDERLKEEERHSS